MACPAITMGNKRIKYTFLILTKRFSLRESQRVIKWGKEFPYYDIVGENRRNKRTKDQSEFNLMEMSEEK